MSSRADPSLNLTVITSPSLTLSILPCFHCRTHGTAYDSFANTVSCCYSFSHRYLHTASDYLFDRVQLFLDSHCVGNLSGDKHLDITTFLYIFRRTPCSSSPLAGQSMPDSRSLLILNADLLGCLMSSRADPSLNLTIITTFSLTLCILS